MTQGWGPHASLLALPLTSAMGAHAFAPAVPAVSPDAVMLADARAPAVLAGAAAAVMLAEAHAPADSIFEPSSC